MKQLLRISLLLVVACAMVIPVQGQEKRTIILPTLNEIKQFQHLTKGKKTVIHNRVEAVRVNRVGIAPSKKIKIPKGGKK